MTDALSDRSKTSLFDWMFRNRRTGRITVAQFPNVALWIYFAMAGLRRVVTNGTAPRTAIDWIAVAALAWWAVDELFRGVNPWRRLLGLGGCGLVVVTLVSLLAAASAASERPISHPASGAASAASATRNHSDTDSAS